MVWEFPHFISHEDAPRSAQTTPAKPIRYSVPQTPIKEFSSQSAAYRQKQGV